MAPHIKLFSSAFACFNRVYTEVVFWVFLFCYFKQNTLILMKHICCIGNTWGDPVPGEVVGCTRGKHVPCVCLCNCNPGKALIDNTGHSHATAESSIQRFICSVCLFVILLSVWKRLQTLWKSFFSTAIPHPWLLLRFVLFFLKVFFS